MGSLSDILARLNYPDISEDSIQPFLSEEDGAPYAVWKAETRKGAVVLKRAKAFELEIYQHFFPEEKPYVPAFKGSCTFEGASYFLTEYFPGRDLRHADRERLVLALDALISLQEDFWGREDLCTYGISRELARKNIAHRRQYLHSSLLEQAFDRFEAIYEATPISLCHEDLLPLNVLVGEDRAVLIDWEHGGMLPYLGSFARLIAHGQEDEDGFFYLARADRDFAIRYYYEHLPKRHGISYDDYRRALDYFLLFEYCEWVMLGNEYNNQEDARFSYYSKKAEELALQLIHHDPAPGESLRRINAYEEMAPRKILDLYAEGIQENAREKYPEMDFAEALAREEADYLDFFQRFLASPENTYWVLEKAGLWISTLRLTRLKPGFYYLEALETHPDYRQQGFAARLIKRVLAELEKEGPFTLCDCVNKKNEASLRTHLACGFRIAREKGMDYLSREVNPRTYGLIWESPPEKGGKKE